MSAPLIQPFFETPLQARTFLLLLAAGFVSGLLLCGLRGARRHLPCSVAAACDVLFWCLTAALCAVSLAGGGEGQVRWYAFLGLLVGAALALAFLRLIGLVFGLIRKKRRKPPVG